jgi:hypothetical protein
VAVVDAYFYRPTDMGPWKTGLLAETFAAKEAKKGVFC